MPRVERVEPEPGIPVEQAQLVQPSAFRLSTAGPEVLRQIGGTLTELGLRKLAMQDRIGISNINALMQNAERDYQAEIINEPIEKHAAILQKHRNNAAILAGQQNLSSEARKFADNKLRIWGDTFIDAGEIATIEALDRDALIAVTMDYEKALAEGTPIDIEEAEIALDEQFEISYTPAEAEVEKEEIEKRAIIQMEQNAVNTVHEAIEAASDLATGTGDFTLARELTKNELIPASRRATLRRTINAAERTTEKRKQDAVMKVTHQEYWQDLRLDNLSELQRKVDTSALPIVGVGGKKWWTDLVSAKTEEIEKNLEVKTDGVIRGNLLTDVYNISIGAVTKREFQQELLKARYKDRKLSDADFDSIWKTSETEFKSWRGAQLQKSLRAVRAQVVTIDESTMERMVGILRGEALEKVQTRRQEEEDKYAEAVKEMDDWLAANPEPTRDDFYKQQRRILRDYRNKTAEQIRQGRAEFKETQTTQPTEERLKAQAAATNDVTERKRIYEQGRELGYWE